MKFGWLCRIARGRGARTGPSRPVGRRARLGAVTFLVALTSACAVETRVPVPASRPAEARVIVRFLPGSPDPTDAAFRARLARFAGLDDLQLIRPMSGDAFVMHVACPPAAGSPDPCAAALARLRAADGIADVEIDAREKPLR